MIVEYQAYEFPSADEAIQHCYAGGFGVALAVNGKNVVVEQQDVGRLAEAGVEFAYLCDHEMPDGTRRIMTVPVN